MKFIAAESKAASKQLAKERGPFPAYKTSTYAERNLGPYRNATTTTIAPTGTLSIIGGCSSGVEPLFALAFSRNVMDGEKLVESNPYFEQALRDSGSWSETLMEDVTHKGSIKHMEHLPEKAAQNLRHGHGNRAGMAPQDAGRLPAPHRQRRVQDRQPAALRHQGRHLQYLLDGLRNGCKGVTVYRDGCKASQVLCTGEGAQAKAEAAKGGNGKVVKSRPDVIYGFTQKIETGLGMMYLTVNEMDGKPFEVFATIGKSGRSITAKAEAIGRLVSLALRSGVSVREIVGQLKGIGGEHPVFRKKGMIMSIPDAIAWTFEQRYLAADNPVPSAGTNGNDLANPKCPDCGDDLLFQEGCFICNACGYTKCG